MYNEVKKKFVVLKIVLALLRNLVKEIIFFGESKILFQ